MVENYRHYTQWVNLSQPRLYWTPNHAGFAIITLDLRNKRCFSSNENSGTKTMIFKAILFDGCGHQRETQNTELVILKDWGGSVHWAIAPGYSKLVQVSGIHSSSLSLWQWWWHVWEESAAHIGPLYWFPDKCCLIPGQAPAASPSFLHTTWGSMRFSSSSCLTLASSCLT